MAKPADSRADRKAESLPKSNPALNDVLESLGVDVSELPPKVYQRLLDLFNQPGPFRLNKKEIGFLQTLANIDEEGEETIDLPKDTSDVPMEEMERIKDMAKPKEKESKGSMSIHIQVKK